MFTCNSFFLTHHRGEEMADNLSLKECGVIDGSTIKLVLTMRGGPINTRRVLLQSSNLSPDQSLCSSDSGVIEQSQIQALMEKHREKIMEGMPKNGQVTVLLFRDGDKLNLYHVLEKPDGSFSPVASATPRSLSGSARSPRSAHYPQF